MIRKARLEFPQIATSLDLSRYCCNVIWMISSVGIDRDKCGGDFLFVETLFQLRVYMTAYAKPGVDVGLAMQGSCWMSCLRRDAVAISRIFISQSVSGKEMSGKEARVIILCIASENPQSRLYPGPCKCSLFKSSTSDSFRFDQELMIADGEINCEV
jgi:hypothetical protein